MRAFYTDPLAAAWMYVRHDFKFTEYNDIHVILDPPLDAKFYIHPDSLHLLEPVEGDIGVTELNSPGEYREGAFRTDEQLELGECKIIQRHNKLFFWPEVEA